MPNILKKAWMGRNSQPEYVFIDYISRYLHMPVAQIQKSGILDGVPFLYSGNQRKQYLYTAVMDRIVKLHISPPDTLHPMHEFTQAEAMLELGVKPDTYKALVKKGQLKLHLSPHTGNMGVYRYDLERFRREWDIKYLIGRLSIPVRRTTAAVLMDIKVSWLKRLVQRHKLRYEPRHYREAFMLGKATMLAHLGKNRKFRQSPLPEYLPPAIAAAYVGITERKLANYRMLGMIDFVEVKETVAWASRWCYSRNDLESLISRIERETYYCEGKEYYTRKAIRYKFLKSERWIDEFISGKCRRVVGNGKIIPAEGDTGFPPKGWLQEDVNAVVASGVDFTIPKKKRRLTRKERKASSIAQKAMPPVVFSSPIEQMEAAISAAMNAGAQKKKERWVKLRRQMADEHARLEAIRGTLGIGRDSVTMSPGRNDILRLSDIRQIVTFAFSSTGFRGHYDEYPNSKDERIFRVSCGATFGRRKIPPSFARAIMNALAIYSKLPVRMTPSWVILVSSTSIISDPMFHRYLEDVPKEYGAVAPFGYRNFLPDGTWDRCPVSYGSYGLYSEVTGKYDRVYGISGNGPYPVGVMDGPFVAIRGEFIREIEFIKFFQQLGDQRGLLGPVMSAICRRIGIKMMQLPVDCWCASEYFVRPGTPEMNLGIELIAKFIDMRTEQLLEKEY